MSIFEEKQLERERIFDGVVLKVVKDKVLLPDGGVSYREFCLHNGGVAVLPLDDDGYVTLVKQYRYAHGREFIEIPAGKLDYAGEDRREAAIRELREETGATCKRLDFMGDFYSSPALLDERISMYLARGLEFGETDFDDDEYIEIERIPVDELVRMICAGEILDAKTQAGVLKAAIIINAEKGESEK